MNSRRLSIFGLRLVMLACGPLFLGFSIACLYWTGLGADPTSVLADGVHILTGWSQPQASNAVNLFLLLLLLCFDRKKIGAATVVCALFIGPCIGLFQNAFFFRIPACGLPLRLLSVIAASVLNSLGLGLYLSAGFGSSAFDGLILCLCERTGLSYKSSLWLFYAVVLLIGIALGGIWGIGTLLSLLLSGPCFQFFYSRLSSRAAQSLGLKKDA